MYTFKPWIVLDDLKLAYCKTPKVGGTSIAQAMTRCLKLSGPVHRALRPFEISMFDFWKRKIHKTHFTFIFVRNPFDRLVSCYQQKILNRNGFGFPSWFNREMSFDDFVKAVEEIFPGNEHIYPYWPSVIDAEAKIFVDFIGRFERLKKDWDLLQKKACVKLLDLKHLNKTEHEDYRKYYTNPETIKRVEDMYLLDLQLFDYKLNI